MLTVIVSRWVYIILTLSSSALTFISDLVTFHPPCATAAMSLCNKCSVALVADEDPPWWWWLLAAADTSSALAAWPGFEDEPPPKFGELQNENIFDQTTTPTEAIFGGTCGGKVQVEWTSPIAETAEVIICLQSLTILTSNGCKSPSLKLTWKAMVLKLLGFAKNK
ncbi:unnamed protein product [Macrosiphum euphorbiae]|uniref:Secreted protein n=1 Tax=Macrosiphum euphorbiae TaxID=13131 RepID=A0AAV0Y0E7_9HEMI|nr:unnamed protein product [Macrosiphum euphorbiae]